MLFCIGEKEIDKKESAAVSEEVTLSYFSDTFIKNSTKGADALGEFRLAASFLFIHVLTTQ